MKADMIVATAGSPAHSKTVSIEPVSPQDDLKDLWDSLLGPPDAANDHTDENRSPTIDPVSPTPLAESTTAYAASMADPLDFVMASVEEAVDRINHEYFFRRDSSEICRQNAATGEIQVITPQQFKTALAGRWVEAVDPKTGKTKVREASVVWLESRSRREVFGVQYCPNHVGLLPGGLNLWLAWGIEPEPGDCSFVLDHILHVIAGGDERKFEFILNWCADILQNPCRKPGVAVVLRGNEGTGKSVLGAILRRLLGPRNVLVNADKDRLLGRFNAALGSKILIQAEETFFAGDFAYRRRSEAPHHWPNSGDRAKIRPEFRD